MNFVEITTICANDEKDFHDIPFNSLTEAITM